MLQPPRIQKWEIPALLILCMLVAVLSWPGLRAPLLLDDLDQLYYTRLMTGWGDIFRPDAYQLFRPVKNAIFYALLPWIDEDIFKMHLGCLACFLSGVVGVWILGRRISADPAMAITIAAVWALAPTQVSSAIWLSCANIGVGVFFLCLALWFYDKARTDNGGARWPWMLAAAVATLLAQCSYETAVAIAPMALALDWSRGRLTRGTFIRTGMAVGVLAAVTVFYLVLRKSSGTIASAQEWNLGYAPGTQKWQLVLSAPWFLWRHLLMWFSPVGNIEFVSTYLWMRSASPLELVWGAVVWLALLATPFLLRKKQPLAALGIAWFLIAAFPAGNFLPIFAGPIEDYYLTVPSLGLAVAVGWWLVMAWRSLRSGEAGSPLLVVLVLLVLGLPRLVLAGFFPMWADVWSRPAEIYARVAASRPHQFQAEGLLAREMLVGGLVKEAEERARASLATAPWHPVSVMVLAEAGLLLENFEESKELFARLAESKLTPIHLREFSQLRMGMLLGMDETTREKGMEFHRAVLANQYSMYHATAVYELAKLYQAAGDKERAAATIERGLQIHPGMPVLEAASAKLASGEPLPDARSFLSELRKANPAA
jgi:tetratricopeptide (TPR) repeat protein